MAGAADVGWDSYEALQALPATATNDDKVKAVAVQTTGSLGSAFVGNALSHLFGLGAAFYTGGLGYAAGYSVMTTGYHMSGADDLVEGWIEQAATWFMEQPSLEESSLPEGWNVSP